MLLLLLFSGTAVKSQDTIPRYNLNLKCGFAVPLEYEVGLMLGGEVSMITEDRVYTGGYAYMEEFTIWTSSNYMQQQIDLLVGKQWYYKLVALQLQGGAGVVWGYERDGTIVENYFAPALFIKGVYQLIPIKYAAFSSAVEINLNMRNPILLLSLGITFGRMRP